MARKILLADDSVTAQNMGRKILADAGYEVITVNNGSAALKRISEQRPDVIVLDVYMPGYSGLEVCQRLKDVGETARIPILLTVGKLEPFKPEEVKRVRADAFIIKPFEASELLSALSKLEDRIVPHAETSKPGRFGRAAMEAPYDKTMAIEEDTSWKNRIAFPKKKKEKEEEQETEEAASTRGKDLHRVKENKIAESPASSKHEERVDLGALASAGLPKDVTPEEIAALAAAAAQIQGGIAESRDVLPAPAPVEPQKGEIKEEPKPVAPPKVEAVAFPVVPEPVAEVKPTEQVEAKDADSPAPASFADQILASAHAEEPSGKPSANAGERSGSQEASEPQTDEPVTMAVASIAESRAHAPRWTAVAATLAPEEAAISLEQEMQQAYAAYAAAEGGHAAAPSESVTVSRSEPAPEAGISVPAIPAPEVAQPLVAVASAAAEAMTGAAEKLEAVASLAAEKHEPLPEAPAAIAERKATPAVEPPVEAAVSAAPPVVEAARVEQPSDAKQSVKAEESIAAEKAEEQSVISTAKSQPGATDVPQQDFKVEAEQRDPNLAAATAAALARLQETSGSHDGEGPEPQTSSEPKAPVQETAAKAVAAGAESHPEEVALSDSDPGIASIVDSVLADLRPKIVEEISRKLGKRK